MTTSLLDVALPACVTCQAAADRVPPGAVGAPATMWVDPGGNSDVGQQPYCTGHGTELLADARSLRPITREEHKDGVGLIAAERLRQLTEEGRSLERDQAVNSDDQLARAAACYAQPSAYRDYHQVPTGWWPKQWPWPQPWWKPSLHDRVRELVKAGALIAAEIDRLQAPPLSELPDES